MASLYRACPRTAYTRLRTSTILQSKLPRKKNLRGLRKKVLAKRWGVRFFTGELRSQQCSDGRSGLLAGGDA